MAVLSCVDLKQYITRGKSMENKIKALTVALENELHERDFYLVQSERTSNPVGKNMFLQIAAEEEEHYRRLQSLHRELSRKGTWPDTVSISVGTSNILQTFRKLASLAEKTTEADRDDIAALNIAVQFEEKAHGFYTSSSAAAETAAERGFFKLLAAVEWEHLLTMNHPVRLRRGGSFFAGENF